MRYLAVFFSLADLPWIVFYSREINDLVALS
jgi:hypothetical protein